jgi:mitotic-spindle organizing protein 1
MSSFWSTRRPFSVMLLLAALAAAFSSVFDNPGFISSMVRGARGRSRKHGPIFFIPPAVTLRHASRKSSHMSSKDTDRIASAQQTLDSTCAVNGRGNFGSKREAVLFDISQVLNTQLDRETLATCVGMIESGVNPEALAVRIICLG